MEKSVEIKEADEVLARPDLASANLLQCPQASPRQRRKSPVTVQEWVASLPPPHVLQRREYEAGKEESG